MKIILMTIMTLSTAFQFLAAFNAICLIRISGAAAAWILLACGLSVQGIRRIIALLHLSSGKTQGDMTVEILGLIISLFMVLGIRKFGPIFSLIQRTRQEQQEKQVELADLNRQLEEEAEARQSMAESLKESEKLFRTVADYTIDWEFWLDQEGRFLYISPSCADLTGYSPEEFYRDPHLLRRIVHPADVVPFDNHRHKVGENGRAEPFDFRIITRDGQERWIGHKCRQVFNDDGTPAGWRASNRNITDRKLMEQQLLELNLDLEHRVRARTNELESINKDLESFCYSISHELRAPIARLEGFSRVLTDCATTNDTSSLLHYAERIGFSSRRLMTVVDSLLMMHRISRLGVQREEVNLSAIAREIVIELAEDLGQHNIHVEISPDLIVQGDRAMLTICLQNLLGNAFKYTMKTAAPSISFGMTRQNSEMIYFVQDNGAGFDMAFSNKLFQPFSRLHNDSEFEGNGIGLATVQKIIEKHGGQIWAKAKPGEGATFFFTLGA